MSYHIAWWAEKRFEILVCEKVMLLLRETHARGVVPLLAFAVTEDFSTISHLRLANALNKVLISFFVVA